MSLTIRAHVFHSRYSSRRAQPSRKLHAAVLLARVKLVVMSVHCCIPWHCGRAKVKQQFPQMWPKLLCLKHGICPEEPKSPPQQQTQLRCATQLNPMIPRLAHPMQFDRHCMIQPKESCLIGTFWKKNSIMINRNCLSCPPWKICLWQWLIPNLGLPPEAAYFRISNPLMVTWCVMYMRV